MPSENETEQQKKKERGERRRGFIVPLLSQLGLADTSFPIECTDLDAHTFRSYLNGETRHPRRDTLRRICDGLNHAMNQRKMSRQVDVSEIPQ